MLRQGEDVIVLGATQAPYTATGYMLQARLV